MEGQPPRKKLARDPASVQRRHIEWLERKPERAMEGMVDPDGQGEAEPALGDDGLPAPPDFVNNVQGSSAGAGSGEFHVYKASRRREYERVANMEAATQEERDAAEYVRTREETKLKDEERTARNRKKRERAKARRTGDTGNLGINHDATNGNTADSMEG